MGNMVLLTVDGSPMEMYVAQPPADKHNGAGIVLMHDQNGLAQFTLGECERWAQEGYAVVAPDNFHHRPKDEALQTKKKNLDDEYIINDIRAATDWLCKHVVPSDRIAIVGYCQGGRMALVGASAEHRFRAAVVLYGGNIFIARGPGPTAFERLKHIRCPVLGLNGAKDKNPSPEDVLKVARELERYHITHEFHSFPTAGHAFANPLHPEHYDPQATAQAWQIAVDFLSKHLSTEQAQSHAARR